MSAQPDGDRDAPEPAIAIDPPGRALIVAFVTTASVVLLSRADRVLPRLEPYIGTLVGAAFLLVAWRLVLRRDSDTVRAYGLALGGVTEEQWPAWSALGAAMLKALAIAGIVALVVFPPFVVGYRIYWNVSQPFSLVLPPDAWDVVLGQLLIVALPEEAFYRGYLQTALERGWGRWRWRVLGAELGVGWIVGAAIFAVGHYAAVTNPARLAVFFPALVFGWLRARTGGIGAGMAFHAMCNLLTDTLARGYLRP